MPDPILSLDHDQVKVAPGSQASIKLTVRSTSSRVEGFRLQVIGGGPSRWTEVNPAEVDVYPGEESVATVVFSPPTGTQTVSGAFPFGVRAQATESADDSAVVEGDVHVGQVDGLQAKLIPVTATARWRGHHVLQLSNQGNTDVELHLSATDPDDLLTAFISPQRVDLGVGEEQSVRLTVRPMRPILLGTPTRLPFQLTGEPIVAPTARVDGPYGAPGRLNVEGAMMQRPVFNRLVLIIVALLVIVLGLYVWWVRTHPPDNTVALSEITALAAPAPAGVTARAVSSSRIRLGWQRLQQVTSYEIWSVVGKTRTKVQNVSWQKNSVDVASIGTSEGPRSLRANHRYCYQVMGMRYDTPGQRSSTVCARTQKAAPAPTPTPTATPDAQPVRYWLIANSYPKVPEANSGDTSSASASAGATAPATAGAAASASATPSPSATPSGQVAAESRRSLQAATTDLNRLLKAGFISAQVVDTETLPKMSIMDQHTNGNSTYLPVAVPTWLVAVGQYPAPDGDLATDCLRLKEFLHSTDACVVAQAPGA